MPDEPVIDTVGQSPRRDDNAVRQSRCARIEIGRPVIVEEDVVRPARMPMMVVVDISVRGE